MFASSQGAVDTDPPIVILPQSALPAAEVSDAELSSCDRRRVQARQ